MKKNLITNIRLCEVKIDNLNQDTRDLFRELIINYGQPYIWTVSDRSTIFENNNDLDKFLLEDFGENYLIYSIYYKSIIMGIVGLTHVKNDNYCGELIIGLKQTFRLRHDFLDWWILFLQFIRKKGVKIIYARIRYENTYVISLSKKFGFINTIDVFHSAKSNTETYNVSRKTKLNLTELNYIKHKNRIN